MAIDEIILTDDTPTNSTYLLMSIKDNEAIYRDQGSSLGNERVFRVAHTVAKNNDGSDRHLVQCNRTDDDADGIPFTGSVYVVLNLPRSGVTSADLILEYEKLRNWLDTNIADVLGGFLPS